MMIEKMDYAGGCSVLGGGGFYVMANPEDVEGQITEWQTYTAQVPAPSSDKYPNYDKLRYVFPKLNETINFMIDVQKASFTAYQPAMAVAGGMAKGLIDKLQANAQEAGIEVRFECKAEEIIHGEADSWIVRCTDKGKPFRIKASKLILAAGDFLRNPDLVREWATYDGLNYVISRAHPGTTGEVIVMAKNIGAALYDKTFALANHLQFADELFVIDEEFRGGGPGASVKLQPQIFVDSDGNRFSAEDAFEKVAVYHLIH